MISNMTGSIDRKVTPCQARRKASADCLLSLAAAPAFAIMALLTWNHGGGMPDMFCSAAANGFPLTGMVPMYLLMSAFHLAPWLGLLSSQPSSARST